MMAIVSLDIAGSCIIQVLSMIVALCQNTNKNFLQRTAGFSACLPAGSKDKPVTTAVPKRASLSLVSVKLWVPVLDAVNEYDMLVLAIEKNMG